MRSCAIDEGRPLEIGFQEQVSNHPKLLRSRVVVVLCQERVRQCEHDAVPEMEEGPPGSACRRGPQTAVSCFSGNTAVVNVTVKRRG